MTNLYRGLKHWQWATVSLITLAWALNQNKTDPLSGEAILEFSMSLLFFAFITRLSVGTFRYLKYNLWDRGVGVTRADLDRERRYFNLVFISIILFGGIMAFAALGGLPGPQDPDNPYSSQKLVVGVENGTDEFNTNSVAPALNYWEGNNSEQYAGYTIKYDLQPKAENPDVVIQLVDQITRCDKFVDNGVTLNIAGCAPLVNDSTGVPDPVVIRVEKGYTHSESEEILKHEIGHTLGLTHEDEPHYIMGREIHID